ncbi:MAG: peptidylprolyl isomerase [Armatimonadota bacterium]
MRRNMRLIAVCLAISMFVTAGVLAAETDKPKDDTPQLGRVVVMDTTKGTIKFALYEKDAPITTKNFIELVERKFYDGLTFHRVVAGFVIQGGDPKGDGTGGSDKKIPLEVSPKLKHDASGVVAMARTSDPNSATSQFYITLDKIPYLDMNYAVFGKVIEGLDAVKSIKVGDVMKTVRIEPAAKPEPAKKDENKDSKQKKASETKPEQK